MKKIITLAMMVVMFLLGVWLGYNGQVCDTPVDIEENQSFDFSQCEMFGQQLSVGKDQMLCCEVHAKN